ncbi:MAG: chlorophyll synthesis pathway protein BchC [Pseudomonadota bacterium]
MQMIPIHEAGLCDASGADLRQAGALKANAVVFEGDRRIDFREITLADPEDDDVIVDVDWSGVSTGTERLLWTGDMPPFPGMGYPLVPGYEATGRVVWARSRKDLIGERVFVPGARCFKDAQGLFGGAASRLVAPASRVSAVHFKSPEQVSLLALAATAHHAMAGHSAPDLIIGHGALGRLLARVAIALGKNPPVVWEIDPARSDADGYVVIDPDTDGRADYATVYDVSGDAAIIDVATQALAPGGEIVLAGFYAERPSFDFASAFMKEIRIRIAAEWRPDDVVAVIDLVESGKLDLSGIISHRFTIGSAGEAYKTAFEDPECLKMVIDWRSDQ